MENNGHLIAFVIDKGYDLLYLHLDLAGIDRLIQKLNGIRNELKSGNVDHFHMFSDEWGNGELSLSSMGDKPDEGRPIHQINVYGWTEEGVRYNKLNKSWKDCT